MGHRLRQHWLTVLLTLTTLGLAYWAWLAYQDLTSILQQLLP